MSLTFRNLFSDEGDEPSAGKAEGSRVASPSSHGKGSTPGQKFLVGELLPFIPPAIAAENGIPMEKEVALPISADGSGDIALSTVYAIVPELFAAEITPLNDSKITLPVRIGAGGPSHKAGVSPFVPALKNHSGVDPEREGAGTATAVAEVDGENPFWSPGSEADGDDEKASTAKESPGVKATATGFSPAPFSAPSAKREEDGFGRNGDGAKESSIPSGFGTGANPFADFSKPHVEPAGESRKEDLPNPSSLSSNPFENSEGFSTLFSKGAEADEEIPFPGSHRGDDDESDAESSWNAVFDPELLPESGPQGGLAPGFGDMIRQSEEGGRSETEVGESEPASPFFGGFSPAASGDPISKTPGKESVSSNPWGEESTKAAFPAFPAGMSGSGSDSGESEEALSREDVPLPFGDIVAEVPVETAPDPKSGPSTAELKPESASPQSFFDQLQHEVEEKPESPMVQSRPSSEVTPSVPEVEVESSPRISVTVGGNAAPARASNEETSPVVSVGETAPAGDESLRDLEFRAIFSTDESFTLSKVARRVASLPGIQGCVLATPTRLVQASKSDDGRLGDEAKEMVGSIKSLAKLTGLPEARSFTLHTDRGTVSLFLEGDCCVTVNHDSPNFGPGIKEKIILIARSIHKLDA